MKLAVIFLSLSVANFIGTSSGGGQTSFGNSMECQTVVHSFTAVMNAYGNAEKCDAGERPRWNQYTCECICNHMNILAKIFKTSVPILLQAAGLTLAQINLLLKGDFIGLLLLVTGLQFLLDSIGKLTQCILAKFNVVLHVHLKKCLTIWGNEDLISKCTWILFSIDTILSTATAVIGILLGSIVGLVGALLGGNLYTCPC
ncbi:uncharacterized protein [Eleutherodactylus coqui]|uniref:uncharacterized protein n=1 Tax=Eleutherodactylus coqui TaxID=57060 RepID=UPI003462B213